MPAEGRIEGYVACAYAAALASSFATALARLTFRSSLASRTFSSTVLCSSTARTSHSGSFRGPTRRLSARGLAPHEGSSQVAMTWF